MPERGPPDERAERAHDRRQKRRRRNLRSPCPLLQRECSCAGAGCDACKPKQKPPEAKLQRAAAGHASPATAPPVVNHVLSAPGRPLDAGARSFMEPRFGRSFGGVRVHTDPEAAHSARAVNAHAYTVGQHIVFDSGKYNPQSHHGQRLLAHELAHTVQQRDAGPPPAALALRETPEYNHLENEADSIAHAVLSRGQAPTARTVSAPRLSRAKNDSTTPPKAPTGATKSSTPPAANADTATGASAPAGDKSERDWQPVQTDALTKAKVKAYAIPKPKTGIVAVQMREPMPLPAEKGPVLDVWKARASAGALDAIIELASGEGKTKAGLKQTRPAPDALQKIWLQKVGWLPANADKYLANGRRPEAAVSQGQRQDM